MSLQEIIRLDAKVVGVIAQSIFRAELPNGHRFVAYAAKADRDRMAAVEAGTVVRVEMSPYDMSRGRIIADDN